jgi:hypothetical protein
MPLGNITIVAMGNIPEMEMPKYVYQYYDKYSYERCGRICHITTRKIFFSWLVCGIYLSSLRVNGKIYRSGLWGNISMRPWGNILIKENIEIWALRKNMPIRVMGRYSCYFWNNSSIVL